MSQSILDVAKPSINGVRLIGLPKKGMLKIQFNEGDEPFEIDVIQVYDAYNEIDFLLRDAEGVLQAKDFNKYSKNRHDFVQTLVDVAYEAMGKKDKAPKISRGEAEAFIAMLREEAKAIRDFFSPKKDEHSSSLPNTEETEIRFSQ